ncbi:unnamed protein product, partial [Polarella glacialis]
VIFSLVLESLEEYSWAELSPSCNMMRIPMTLGCNSLAATMWILTPGLVEETGKALWLFLRLRRVAEDLPSSCCLGMFPARGSFDCGCWYKLAGTPYHVVLCALASGAGFESLENLKYVFMNTDAMKKMDDPHVRLVLLGTACARLLTSGLHMVWTGLVGWGLARRLFLPEAKRPSLAEVMLPSIILHGLFDYAISAIAWTRVSNESGMIDEAESDELAVLFVLLFLGTALGSCFVLARLTGLRFFRPVPSCCCAPGFWEAHYKAPVIRVPPPLSVAEPQVSLEEPLLQEASSQEPEPPVEEVSSRAALVLDVAGLQSQAEEGALAVDLASLQDPLLDDEQLLAAAIAASLEESLPVARLQMQQPHHQQLQLRQEEDEPEQEPEDEPEQQLQHQQGEPEEQLQHHHQQQQGVPVLLDARPEVPAEQQQTQQQQHQLQQQQQQEP